MWIIGEDVSWGFNYDLADMIGVNHNKLVFHMRDSNCQYVLEFNSNLMAKEYWLRMDKARVEGNQRFVIPKVDLKMKKKLDVESTYEGGKNA